MTASPPGIDGQRPRPPRQLLSRRFKGVRRRSWGAWVAEIRVPRSRQRLWLGSYQSPQQAARAYDVAALCLRGPAAVLNLPSLPPAHTPDPACLSPASVRDLAAREAAQFRYPLPADDPHSSETPALPSPLPPCSSASPFHSPDTSHAELHHGDLRARAELDHGKIGYLPPCSSASPFHSPNTTHAELDHRARAELDHGEIGYPTPCSSASPFHSPDTSHAELDHGDLRARAELDHGEIGYLPAQTDLHHLHGSLDAAQLERTPPASASSPSLLDLWFSLDLCPAVDPSLRELLADSLFPSSQQKQ